VIIGIIQIYPVHFLNQKIDFIGMEIKMSNIEKFKNLFTQEDVIGYLNFTSKIDLLYNDNIIKEHRIQFEQDKENPNLFILDVYFLPIEAENDDQWVKVECEIEFKSASFGDIIND
jgi:hypothetical protein